MMIDRAKRWVFLRDVRGRGAVRSGGETLCMAASEGV